MLARLTITLAEDEKSALQRMAEAECRYPRDQIRYLVRQAAEKQGLITVEVKKESQHEPDRAAA